MFLCLDKYSIFYSSCFFDLHFLNKVSIEEISIFKNNITEYMVTKTAKTAVITTVGVFHISPTPRVGIKPPAKLNTACIKMLDHIFFVTIRAKAHIAPIRKEYPTCCITGSTEAPLKRFAR